MIHRMLLGPAAWLLGTAVLAGCDERKETIKGEAPPPLVSAKPGACDGDIAAVKDPLSRAFFPPKSSGYCLDPNGEPRAYGKDAPNTLDQLCIEQLDGECDVYKSFGLDRAVSLRYIDGGGTPGAVSINLTRYTSPERALAFFTHRIIANADPARSAPKPLEAGGLAALGSGIAYVWRGSHVAELSYTNELESPDQLRASSAKVLPDLTKTLGEKLPGPKDLPAAVQALPEAERVASGIQYSLDDVLDVAGIGEAATGYYKRDGKRYRVVVMQRRDDVAAKDLVASFRKASGYRQWKEHPMQLGNAFVFEAGAADTKTEWLFGRRGQLLIGVGDEELVIEPSMNNDQRESLKLTRAEKQSLLLELLSPENAPKSDGSGGGATTGDADSTPAPSAESAKGNPTGQAGAAP